MGQAIADLPNSTEKPAEPIGNADELLSQLAGEEIDRLLAEADAHPIDPAAADAPIPAPIAEPTSIADASVARDPADPTIREMPPIVTGAELDQELAAAAKANAPEADQFEAQVNELFNELKERSEEQPPAPAAADVPPNKPNAQDVTVSALATELESPTTAAERAALQQAAPAQLQPAVEVRQSVIVRILEIVNAPVSSLPDPLRDTLGKVAILTLMNSIGLLLYLFMFKK